MVVNIQAEKEMYRQISEERTGKRERTEYTDKKEQTELHTTVRMISTARFSVHILLLHHYMSNLSHLSDFDSLVIGLLKSER